MDSLGKKIEVLIDPNFGHPSPLTERDHQFVENYVKQIESTDDGPNSLAFRNVIIREGNCGFGNFGFVSFLLNTDRTKRYRVTVRISWRNSSFETGTFDRIHINEAGGKLRLGCSDSGGIPTTDYTYQIVGEVAL